MSYSEYPRVADNTFENPWVSGNTRKNPGTCVKRYSWDDLEDNQERRYLFVVAVSQNWCVGRLAPQCRLLPKLLHDSFQNYISNIPDSQLRFWVTNSSCSKSHLNKDKFMWLSTSRMGMWRILTILSNLYVGFDDYRLRSKSNDSRTTTESGIGTPAWTITY